MKFSYILFHKTLNMQFVVSIIQKKNEKNHEAKSKTQP